MSYSPPKQPAADTTHHGLNPQQQDPLADPAVAAYGTVDLLVFDSTHYVGAQICVHNHDGGPVGVVTRLDNREYIVVAGEPEAGGWAVELYAGTASECVGVANDAEEFALWVSPHILSNVERVLIEVFGWVPDQAERYTSRLREIAERSGGGEVDPEEVSPGIRITDCPDFEDNRILELTPDVEASLIVSNDKEHLIPMSPWRGTPIIIDSEFVARVDAARRARKRHY